MARIKRSVHGKKKRRKVLDRASGYKGARGRRFRTANEQVMHALQDAYRDRRARKGDFRRLWITRINAAARQHGVSYSRFIGGLKAADIDIDRKMLAELAVSDPEAFGALVTTATEAFEAQAPPQPAPAEKPKAEEPKAEKKVEEPKAEKKVEEPKAEKKVEEPKAEKKAEEPKAEKKAEKQAAKPAAPAVAELEEMEPDVAAAALKAYFAPSGDGDDLKEVKGVGPVMEERLNEAGIISYAQLAGLSGDDLERVSTVVSGFRDEWVEHAKDLAG